MLICRARNALPMSTWHLTALCMSGFKHTQFHKSFTFQAYSCLAERPPVACLDTLGYVITCGVKVCLRGKAPSAFIWGCVCTLGVILSCLGGKPVTCDTYSPNSATVFILRKFSNQNALAKPDGGACTCPWVLNVWIMHSLGDKEVNTTWKTYKRVVLVPKYNEARQVDGWSMTNSVHRHSQPYLTLKSRFSLFWSQRATYILQQLQKWFAHSRI